MPKLTLKNVVIGIFVIIFAYIILTLAQSIFPTSIFLLWILAGVILGIAYKSKFKIFIITYALLTLGGDIVGIAVTSVKSKQQSNIILDISVLVSLILLFFLVKKVYQLSPQQNKFPIDIGALEKNNKLFLAGLSVLLFISLASTAASVTQINKFHSEDLIHEQKKQDVDKNYLEATLLIKNGAWQDALSKLNDVIEINPNYQNTQANLLTIKSNIAKLEKQKQLREEHDSKLAAIKAPKEAKINKWFSNKELEEQNKRSEFENSDEFKMSGDKETSSYYFWPDEIIWLDENYTKAKVIGTEKIIWSHHSDVLTKVIYIFTFSGSKLDDAEFVSASNP